MAFAPLSERGVQLPPSAAVEFRPEKPLTIIPGDSFRFPHEGRGIGLRTHVYGRDAYRDYEMECFNQKLARIVEKISVGLEGEHKVFDPALTDQILPKEDFKGLRLPDFLIFRILPNSEAELSEFVEVKTPEEFMNEVRAKVDINTGFPATLKKMQETDYLKKVKTRLSSIFLPALVLPSDLEKVRFRFMSPDSQQGRTTFQRWRTPHEVVDMPNNIAEKLGRVPKAA